EAKVEEVAVNAARDSIDRHAIKSPINGIVYEVAKDTGEWVTAGESVIKIARMDRIRISTTVDGNQYRPSQISDRAVTVTLNLPNEKLATFEGKVVFVAPNRSTKNEYIIWAEVDNLLDDNGGKHWLLNPGNTVDMKIHLGKPALQSASTNRLRSTNK
ncbi:MAG: HlyD family secretion protein, partial [Planctomycetota bacterium]